MIDGYGGDQELLNNENLVLSCLDELPHILEMHKLAPPEVYFAPANDVKDPGGWSGFVVIAESHISIHTFPKRGFVSADVYTCRSGLDVDLVLNFFMKKFNLKDIEKNFAIRGTHYPQNNIY